MDQREEFEAWFASRDRHKRAEGFFRCEDGEYAYNDVNFAWEAWKESARRSGERNAEKDVAEAIALWDAAMAHAAFYVNDHCVDGEFHAEAIITMNRPSIRAAAAPPEGKEK